MMEISNQTPCQGCGHAYLATGGYWCGKGSIFVPFGYLGCKLSDDLGRLYKSAEFSKGPADVYKEDDE